jgi:DivIVA domain-containing protein
LDVVPLTPTVVDCVTFDRAPLGRRGYNEDQVDDFLDRVQATLAGKDTLTAQNVRDVVFDPAAFIRRGYHEDQVDEFLDLVVEELDRRSGNPRQAPRSGVPVARTGSPTAPVPPFPTHMRQTPPPGATEQTAPMLFSLPPSMPAPSTQPLKRDEPAATDAAPATNGKHTTPTAELVLDTSPAGSESAVATPASTEAEDTTEPSTALQTAAAPQPSAPEQPAAPPTETTPESTNAQSVLAVAQSPAVASPTLTDDQPPQQSASSKAREFETEAWRDGDHLALPLPPAPPGERGYRPGDVERLMKLLAAMLADPSSPGPDEFANLKLSRTFFVGQGYHAGAVDTLRQAWLDELTRRAL